MATATEGRLPAASFVTLTEVRLAAVVAVETVGTVTGPVRSTVELLEVVVVGRSGFVSACLERRLKLGLVVAFYCFGFNNYKQLNPAA